MRQDVGDALDEEGRGRPTGARDRLGSASEEGGGEDDARTQECLKRGRADGTRQGHEVGGESVDGEGTGSLFFMMEPQDLQTVPSQKCWTAPWQVGQWPKTVGHWVCPQTSGLGRSWIILVKLLTKAARFDSVVGVADSIGGSGLPMNCGHPAPAWSSFRLG